MSRASRRRPLSERLLRLALLAKAHEVQAEPCTPERALRGQRADHLAVLCWAAQQEGRA
ncbi:hypothetical protein [Deinococcus gobiensis]|uniref:Uncharacterized protein n=1 Tax=Deinococcus gobiensis (strain DSM 21396 / JCM 16679 / CGMCC 1.7299 / I-0) TaxID=745776 RepID=H8H3V7_DEIGI|nr:hypothetical protein [Deinococcus gobiensis]AFD28204.1 hypothetical protein DGo_PE0060 [Deinococcus gobiensis I-0]